MSSHLRYIFDLDRQVRIYLRFIIESFVILAAYVLWLVSIDGWGQLSMATHILNAVIWISAYKVLGLQKDRLRFSNLTSYLPIVRISLFLGSILAVESLVLMGTLDITALLAFVLVSLNILVGLRVVVRQLIRRESFKKRDNILVYGTSDIAIDLVNAMAFGKKYNVVGFISDKPQSVGSLAGLPVIRFGDVERYANAQKCKLVVLASQSLSTSGQTEVLLKLDKLGLSVSHAPTIDRAFDYEVRLKAVKPEEVLGRESEVKFDDTVQAELHKKSVLVTGAGGSIGSEICRQILRYQPEKLIILELNEFALYTLEQEISEFLVNAKTKIQVYYHLGSVTDEIILNRVFKEQKIDIVYHTAAYKHVPIVEENIIAGINNNVFGTKLVADFAHRFDVDKFVLVSTDKAVRPTNVMGASKRLAELVIQDLAKTSKTVFTLVRFGNVLGSSGSVIPKFKSQINAGGPITVTHEEITRYFMSIPEAAHLVLNAGAFASGGDVFLLDMGDPVKIVNLAKSMVRQHGLQPIVASGTQRQQKRDNEILIEFSGLRPGEKLYEELLVDGVAQETPNTKIFKSQDGVLVDLDLTNVFEALQRSIQDGRPEAIIKQLLELPLSYQPSTSVKPKRAIGAKVDQTKNAESETTVEKKSSVSTPTHRDSISRFKRLISSKLGLAILHRYFLVTRGMTLGVRVLLQNHKGEILLVKHTYVPGWHLPGGGVDHGEDVETAARREVFEETGISELEDLRFTCLEFNEVVSDRDHVSYFKARTNQNPLTKQTSEVSEIRFVSREVASAIITPEHKKYILENT